jgi:hypothetical protein
VRSHFTSKRLPLISRGIAEHSQNKYRCFGFVLILSQV